MSRLVLAVAAALSSAVVVAACSGDSITNVYGTPLASSSSSSSSSSGSSSSSSGGSTSTSGIGGAGGASAYSSSSSGAGGGSVGQGGGDLDAGPDAPTAMCPATCGQAADGGVDIFAKCGDAGVCKCSDLSADSDAVALCQLDGKAWCDPHGGCWPAECGDPAPGSVPTCQKTGTLGNAAIWCCY